MPGDTKRKGRLVPSITPDVLDTIGGEDRTSRCGPAPGAAGPGPIFCEPRPRGTLLDKGNPGVQKLCRKIMRLPQERKARLTGARPALTGLARLCFPPICSRRPRRERSA